MNKTYYFFTKFFKNYIFLRHTSKKLLSLIPLLGICFSTFAQPSGFQDQLKVLGDAGNGLFATIGITFDEVGQMYAHEKDGKVWAIRFNTNNVEQRYLMLDLTNEVLNNNDLGLVSMELDPNFLSNGYFYLMYAVNRQFLIDGTDGGDDASQSGSIVRVTRYTADVNASPSFSVVVPNSRLVLLGTTPQEGIPILGVNHGGGCLKFGSDGTLLVSTGDGGATGGFDIGDQGYYNEAMALGIITPAQNIGTYRSQRDDCLNGKVLRINPANGDGIPSNPLYNSTLPRSAESRMWAKGLRNPFRMTLIPNTGEHYPSEGNPGIIVVGDVGSSFREEINTITAPNQNFGWPHYEGIDFENFSYDSPLYIPATYRKPIFEYRTSPEHANVFLNQTTKKQLGTGLGEFPFTSPNPFVGNTIILGEFYQGTDYPSQYQNALFFADFSAKWIKVMKLDSNYEPVSIEDFMELPNYVVGMKYNHVDNSMYYVTGQASPCNEIRKLTYSLANNPPIAKITLDTNHGIAPLAVAFSAIKSYDPEATNLTYEWSIDNNPVFSTGLSPHFVFNPSGNNQQIYKVKLIVRDENGTGLVAADSVNIYANNTPPTISSTSVDNINSIPPNQSYLLNLSAVVSDTQTSANNLQLSWSVGFLHNGHEHTSPSLSGNNVSTTLTAVGCEVGVSTYMYKIYLKVIDPQGLSKTTIKSIQINCPGNTQTISFNPIPNQEITLGVVSSITASAVSSVGATPVNYFNVTGPAYTIGNQVKFTGKTGQVIIRATQHGNSITKPALPVEQIIEVDRNILHNSISFDAITDKLTTDPSFSISASTSPTQETVRYILISGPATVSGNTVTLTGSKGVVKIRAYYEGNYLNSGIYTDRTFNVISAITQDEIIYGDALNTNWSDYSTFSSSNIGNASVPFINTHSIKVTNPTINETLDLRYNTTSVNTIDYPYGFEFWVYNEGNSAFPLLIQAYSTNLGIISPTFTLDAAANKWTLFQLEWNTFNNITQVGRIVVKLGQSQPQSLYFDEIKLLHCADMNTLQTGNWDNISTWSCNRLPISTDVITINSGHTVTVLNGVSATLRLLQLLGTVNVQTGGNFNISKF
jgi:glucose/arabinose dehydrogenase